MNYWMTTHWPPRIGDDPTPTDFGLWLPDDRKEAGNDFKIGDQIIIYQSKGGKPEIFERADGSKYSLGCQIGKMGIIAFCEAVSDIYKLTDSKPSKYTDGKEIWWRWYAKLKLLTRTGFVSQKDTNEVLGYKSNYSLRGFGDLKSGLKKLSKSQFDSLLYLFKSSVSLKDKSSFSKSYEASRHGGEESDAHKNLKLYVAANPSIVLSEIGVSTYQVEFPFPTMDRADIILEDQFGRILGVEIEVSVGDGQIEGLLQAIKYRFMGELMMKRKPGDSRSVLIAYSISSKMKRLCEEYNIQSIEVDRSIVESWVRETENNRTN